MLLINYASPAPAESNVYPFTGIDFNIISDSFPVNLSTLNVSISNYSAVALGQPTAAWSNSTITQNDFGGYNIKLKFDEYLSSDTPYSVIVNCYDTDGVSFNASWSFTIGDFQWPILNKITPKEFSDNIASGQVITFEVVDINGASIDEDTLNIWIRSKHIVKDGVENLPLLMQYNSTLVAPNVLQVQITPVVLQWTEDYNYVQVYCKDGAGNKCDILFYYRAGDKTPPVIDDLNPKRESFGLSNSTSLSFYVYDKITGVDLNTIVVTVNSAPAIVNGVPVGQFSSSTLTPTASGYSVTINNSSTYTDGKLTTVVIQADDNNGNTVRYAYWVHIGTLQITSSKNDSDVDEYGHNRFLNNTLSIAKISSENSSFHNPDLMAHTGYAYDGLYYTVGRYRPDIAPASWSIEGPGTNRGDIVPFPASCYAITSNGGWSIVESHGDEYNMWMKCPIDPGITATTYVEWSMAGNHAPGPVKCMFDDGKLFVLSDRVYIVDFTQDKAFKIDEYGLQESTGNISSRQENQDGNNYNFNYRNYQPPFAVFTDGSYAFMRDVRRPHYSWIVATVYTNYISHVGLASKQTAARLNIQPGIIRSHVKTDGWIPDFIDITLDNGVAHSLMVVHQGSTYKLVVAPFASLLKSSKSQFYPSSPYIVLYSIGTPIIAWDNYVHGNRLYVALATDTSIKLIRVVTGDYSNVVTSSIPIANLGLSVLGASISKVSLEHNIGASLSEGIIHVAADNGVLGEIVRYDIENDSAISLYSGIKAKSLVSVGSSEV